METWALVITWSTAFWSMCWARIVGIHSLHHLKGHPGRRSCGGYLEQVGLALHLGCDGPGRYPRPEPGRSAPSSDGSQHAGIFHCHFIGGIVIVWRVAEADLERTA